jgi:hypothetical protein
VNAKLVVSRVTAPCPDGRFWRLSSYRRHSDGRTGRPRLRGHRKVSAPNNVERPEAALSESEAERTRWALNRLPTSPCYDCFRDELVSSGATDLGRLLPVAKHMISVIRAAASQRCYSAWKIGSGAVLVTPELTGTDDASFEQIEISTAVHLALHKLELGDLTFRLAVRPG